MGSKRLGSPLGGQPRDHTTNKKLKIEVPPTKAFCGISDITPQTSTLPPQEPKENNTDSTRTDGSPTEVWLAIELFRPINLTENEKPMVKILGAFTNSTAALEHAEEHVRALRTVTTHGVRSEPEREDDRDDDTMSETSVYERKLEVFRDMYVDDEEEAREDGGKLWTVNWGNVTEVWAEKREVFECKSEAGYFTPLPILGEDDRD